jgi:hypothetical protein
MCDHAAALKHTLTKYRRACMCIRGHTLHHTTKGSPHLPLARQRLKRPPCTQPQAALHRTDLPAPSNAQHKLHSTTGPGRAMQHMLASRAPAVCLCSTSCKCATNHQLQPIVQAACTPTQQHGSSAAIVSMISRHMPCYNALPTPLVIKR